MDPDQQEINAAFNEGLAKKPGTELSYPRANKGAPIYDNVPDSLKIKGTEVFIDTVALERNGYCYLYKRLRTSDSSASTWCEVRPKVKISKPDLI